MNAGQRRKHARRVWRDHFLWPLGTVVTVLAGHHSGDAVGMVGKVAKHGRPCTHRVNCIVDFERCVFDVSAGFARYAHYVDFRHLRKLQPFTPTTVRKPFPGGARAHRPGRPRGPK